VGVDIKKLFDSITSTSPVEKEEDIESSMGSIT